MAFYKRQEIEALLLERDLLMQNAWSFSADASKEELAKILKEASKKAAEIDEKIRSLLKKAYKKKSKRLIRAEIKELLHEKEISNQDYLDILLFVHNKVREK